MQLALETYNNVVQSTRNGFKYCELLSGTNANQCFATTLQPLDTSVVQVNIAMQALVEGVTSSGTCVSYLHETIKRGNAVANGYKKVIQTLSESDDAKAAVLRLKGLAQPSKWWRQDTVAMATTCGTPGK